MNVSNLTTNDVMATNAQGVIIIPAGRAVDLPTYVNWQGTSMVDGIWAHVSIVIDPSGEHVLVWPSPLNYMADGAALGLAMALTLAGARLVVKGLGLRRGVDWGV